MDDYERNMHLRELPDTGPSSHTNTNHAESSWPAYNSNKADQDHPLALHNLPTATASHHEHAPAAGEPLTHDPDPNKTSSHLQNTRLRLGLHPTAPVIEEHDLAAHNDWWWPRIRLTLKEPFAEFFGVFIMVLFGDGAVAQVLLSHGSALQPAGAPGGAGFGDYQSISWGWGLGVMLGIYVAGDSGAYLK
ncbi:hypothetical protein LTR65_009162 [Meristemomyces frigidus]